MVVNVLDTSASIINEGILTSEARSCSTLWDWIKWMGKVVLNLVIYVAPPVTVLFVLRPLHHNGYYWLQLLSRSRKLGEVERPARSRFSRKRKRSPPSLLEWLKEVKIRPDTLHGMDCEKKTGGRGEGFGRCHSRRTQEDGFRSTDFDHRVRVDRTQ
ncbi:uncharacterized protein EI90DRAFT_550415 [Cantharellus anzutake]|uniref:uncharacterized protein n=1 Tax=Cantharellus anzutake TaxID=1750568 RepID=UPI0019030AB7|nr:uncharacterized protein EI90DRAFT_550415 [Cantharellus anzutake]KAF8313541.1 hypothetical protein EI90DRAFT_550415 [Cantharellus anzutake]